ncbi:hypothetical protein [Streptomyces sp. NPDC059788]|uniref:hypothetical protein n=1 Tax=Streptomyces sp. NPDC059788 TaxID=3346948 RepID=UPI00365633F3
MITGRSFSIMTGPAAASLPGMNQGNGDVDADGSRAGERPGARSGARGNERPGVRVDDPAAPANGYEVRPGVPTADTYRWLRRATGLGAKSAEGAAIGLPNTWYGVTVHATGAGGPRSPG